MSTNEAMYAWLPALESAAVDAVREYTRSRMYHKFTRQPKRSFYHVILPSVPLFPVAELERRGWPYDPAEVSAADGQRWAAHKYEHGRVYYELVEDRLARADYERRLVARQVSAYEYHLEMRAQRVRQRNWHLALKAAEAETYFDEVMRQLARQLQTIAGCPV